MKNELSSQKGLTPYQQSLSLCYLSQGLSPSQISQRINVPTSRLKKFFSSHTLSSAQAALQTLVTQTLERTKARLELESEQALDTIVKLMNTASSEKIRFLAAQDILDRNQVTQRSPSSPTLSPLITLTINELISHQVLPPPTSNSKNSETSEAS